METLLMSRFRFPYADNRKLNISSIACRLGGPVGRDGPSDAACGVASAGSAATRVLPDADSAAHSSSSTAARNPRGFLVSGLELAVKAEAGKTSDSVQDGLDFSKVSAH